MDPANAVVTVGFLSAIVAYVIEWVRTKWPTLDGDLLRVVAIAAGVGLAFAYNLNIDIEGLPESLGKVATGLAIAGVSGFFGTAKNFLRARDPKSSIHEEG